MSKRVRPPAEKKRLSYERDGRNTYGENSKASRKAIPRFKAASNRTMRHNTKQIVAAVGRVSKMDSRLADETFRGLHPIKSKVKDTPLGEVVVRKKKKRAGAASDKARRKAALEGFRVRQAEASRRYLESLERRRVARNARRRSARKALKKVSQ